MLIAGLTAQGAFGPQQTISASADGTISVLAADLDGDGDADVISGSFLDDKVAWYQNLIPPPSEVFGAGCAGLTLTGNAMQLDSTWDLQLANVSSTSLGGIFFVGQSALTSGIPVSAFCAAYTSADLGFFFEPAMANISTWTLPIPNDPTLLGLQLTVQATAASPSPEAWIGIALSNGLRGTVNP